VRPASIDLAQLLPRLDRGEPLLLLDVRNVDEFEAWKLEPRRPVETLHVPYFEFIEDSEAALTRVPRGRELVVLCAQGGSSELVVGLLRAAGVNAANVAGGMLAYGGYLEPVRLALGPSEAGRFELWQVNRRGRGCLSYVVVAGGEAVVVDPSRRVDWYQGFAGERDARIVRVLDTHIHADHVSGGPELARRAGVPYFVSAGPGFELGQRVTPLADRERIRLGGEAGVSIEVRVLRTPGHTPGSTSFLVGERHLITGDTLFVTGVGRPDLGGHLEAWGRELYVTLSERLAELAPDTRVLPAHFSSAAEVAADGSVTTTLGRLRAGAPELQLGSADAFVEAVRGAVVDPPPAYAEITRLNLGARAGDDQIAEWELGRNQCATSSLRAGRA
jgi:glyoxylase-like metal-dependent hydrolase (beta-lactamase superfamily II)/rhodanese-related sulfurtransferase